MAPLLRVPQIDLSAVLTGQNAQIDLKLEVYESSTRNFLKAVSNYKNRALTTISARRSDQATEKKKILDKTRAVEAETIQCKLKEIELVSGTPHLILRLATLMSVLYRLGTREGGKEGRRVICCCF